MATCTETIAPTKSCDVHGFLKACKNKRKMVSSSRKLVVSAVKTLPKPPQFAAPPLPPPKGLKRVRPTPSDSELNSAKTAKTVMTTTSNIDGADVGSVPVRQMSSVVGRPPLECPPAQDGGGAGVVDDQASQLSPARAARVASLMSRFAGTIVKAQHTLLGDQSESTTEAKIASFSKMINNQRQRDREAARLALTEMEKNVVIDDNFKTMKEFEMLISGINCFN